MAKKEGKSLFLNNHQVFHYISSSGICILYENDNGFMDVLDTYPDCPNLETSENLGRNQWRENMPSSINKEVYLSL